MTVVTCGDRGGLGHGGFAVPVLRREAVAPSAVAATIPAAGMAGGCGEWPEGPCGPVAPVQVRFRLPAETLP